MYCLRYGAFLCKATINLEMQMRRESSGHLLPHINYLVNLSPSTIGNEVQGRIAGRCGVTFIPSMLSIMYFKLTVIFFRSFLLIKTTAVSTVVSVLVPSSKTVCL